MKNILLTLLVLAFMASCSPPQGKTKAKFKFFVGSLVSGPANFSGGLMIYGKSSDGKSFGKASSSTDLSEEISNGTWNFYVVGWEGSSALEGTVYCAKDEGVELNGEEVNISLTASNANCNDTVFSFAMNGSLPKTFPRIKLHSCSKLNAVSNQGSSCEYDPAGLSGTELRDRGFIASYKIIIPSYNSAAEGELNLKDDSEAIVSSRCTPVITGNSPSNGEANVSMDVNIPLGSDGSPFTTIVRGYIGKSDCTDTKGYKDFVFKNGLQVAAPDTKTFTYNSSGNEVKVFTKITLDEVCSGERIDPASAASFPFAGGVGSPGAPYVICTAYQLNSINHRYEDKSFILAKDIDLNPLSAIINPPPSSGSYNQNFIVKAPPCTKREENFYPIGGWNNSAECAAMSHPMGGWDNTGSSGHDAFTGVFDGGNKTVSNLRINRKGSFYVGMFREVNGGKVLNLTLENAKIKGQTKVGAIAGKVHSGALIQNVVVKKSRISSDHSGGQDIGGAVGRAEGASTNLKKIYVRDSFVEGANDGVGGAFGYVQASTVNSVTVKRTNVSCDNNDCLDTGGVVGKVENTNLTKVGFKGEVYSSGKQVGGIVGSYNASSGSILGGFYTSGLVQSDNYDIDLMVGGAVGSITSNSLAIQNGLVMNKVIHDCNANTTACQVSDLVGKKASTSGISKVFIYDQVAFTGRGGETGVSKDLDTITGDGTMVGSAAGKLADTIWSQLFQAAGSYGAVPTIVGDLAYECTNIDNLKAPTIQIASGKGVETNPVIICSMKQLLDIPDNSTSYYVLADDLLSSGNIVSGTQIKNFAGTLDGRGHSIINLQMDKFSDWGLFNNINASGTIKNLKVYGATQPSGASNVDAGGFLAANNFGTIENVTVVPEGEISNTSGGIVSTNKAGGKIVNSVVFGSLKGLESVGGVAYKNEGQISGVSSYLTMSASGAASQYLGGLVADNIGTIKESEFSGHITHYDSVGASFFSTNGDIAGIAAKNTGVIENVHVTKEAKFETDLGGASSGRLGGIVADNSSGAVRQSIMQGELSLGTSYTASSEHGAIVGKNDLGGIVERSYATTKPFSKITESQNSSNLFSTTTCTQNFVEFNSSSSLLGQSYALGKELIFTDSSSNNTTLVTANGTTFNGSFEGIQVEKCDQGFNWSNLVSMIYDPAGMNLSSSASSGVCYEGFKLYHNVSFFSTRTPGVGEILLIRDDQNNTAYSRFMSDSPDMNSGTTLKLDKCNAGIGYSSLEQVSYGKTSSNTLGDFVHYDDSLKFSTYCKDDLTGLTAIQKKSHICSTGMDVIQPESGALVGEERVYGFFKQKLGLAPDDGLTDPVWQIEGDDIRLFKVNNL